MECGMKLIENYPGAVMFLTFFVLSCASAHFPGVLKIILASLSVIFVILLALLPKISGKEKLGKKLRRSLIFAFSASFAALAVSYSAFDMYAAGFDKYGGESGTVELKITECVNSLSYSSQYKAKVVSSDVLPKGCGVLLNTSLGYMEEGSVVSGEASFTSLGDYLGSFDAKSYYFPKRVMLVCEDEGLEYKYTEKYLSPSALFAKLNRKLSAMIAPHVGGSAGGLLSAVLLGNRTMLDESLKRDFRRIGISHLLAVSGTHFSVVMTAFASAVGRLKLPKKLKASLAMLLIVFFMGLTGFTPSVVRAGIMQLIMQLSIIVMKKPNTINSFALSGTLLIISNPLLAVDCGLQLSFTAACSCIIFEHMRKSMPHMKNRKAVGAARFLHSVADTFLMTVFVTLGTLPLTWLYFGEISLISVFSNLIFIPLVTLLMYLGALYLLLYPLRLFIVPLAALVRVYCGLITGLAGFFAGFHGITTAVNYPFTVFFVLPLTVCVIALPFVRGTMRGRVAAAAGCVCVLFFGTIFFTEKLDEKNDYVTYISAGKNDGFVVKSGGKALLCEISDASFGFMYNLTDELAELHCCEIDFVLVTHYHNKHTRLLTRLCERETVSSLILSEPIDERERDIFESLTEIAGEYGLDVTVVGSGEEFTFGRATLSLYERKYISRSSHPITGLKIGAGGEEVVYSSCSLGEGDADVLRDMASADCVILGRHSPKYKKSFGITFEREPKLAVISSDAYEHTDGDTAEYFDSHGFEPYPDGELINADCLTE